ncbi:SCO4402 family protein [Streptomyces flaveolus]|uniref:SCO4402 family protein n=1 Tax=Streptomyces flaveolus TaxID=67297 RepID=UPI003F4CD660
MLPPLPVPRRVPAAPRVLCGLLSSGALSDLPDGTLPHHPQVRSSPPAAKLTPAPGPPGAPGQPGRSRRRSGHGRPSRPERGPHTARTPCLHIEGALPDPEAAVGEVLRDDAEARAMHALADLLDPLIDELGDAHDSDYLASVRWPTVVAAARTALRSMT